MSRGYRSSPPWCLHGSSRTVLFYLLYVTGTSYGTEGYSKRYETMLINSTAIKHKFHLVGELIIFNVF
jgi:hypothetical protein